MITTLREGNYIPSPAKKIETLFLCYPYSYFPEFPNLRKDVRNARTDLFTPAEKPSHQTAGEGDLMDQGNIRHKKIGIFGSFARGEQNRKSDIDVLVEFEEGHATLHNFIGLSDYLEELFKRKVDLLIESSLSDLIRPYIEKDVIWIEG